MVGWRIRLFCAIEATVVTGVSTRLRCLAGGSELVPVSRRDPKQQHQTLKDQQMA
jgi:hypothetical protein